MRKSYSSKLTFNKQVSFYFGELLLKADVRAEANYYYEPCVMYFKDGTGQPEYEEFDIDTVEVSNLISEEGDLQKQYEADKDFRNSIDEAIIDYLNENYDNEDWSSDTPDDDYYDDEF